MKKPAKIEYLELNQSKIASPAALFFHGYGANAQDLSGFQTLKLPVPCRWIFPNGPVELEATDNIFGGRAWFPLKMNNENNQFHANENSLFYLNRHCQQLLKFIQSLNLGSDKIILGGFSQGAVIALNLALRMNPPPRALIIMSGSFFPLEILNKEKKTFSKGSSFFQCHGKKDPLLLYSESKHIYNFLQSLQWQGEFVSFDGGHEIPHAVLLQIQEFISHKLS